MSLDLSIDSSRDLTLELCTFLTNLKYTDLSPELVHVAKQSIFNSIGCGLSSSVSSLPAAAKLYKALDVTSKSPRPATVLAVEEFATVDDAALLNGLNMTARFYDDTHLGTVVHPSGPPLAAALAYAESEGLSGKELILAFVVGVEMGLVIAKALGLGPYKKGWHLTSIVGSFAAAAAVAKLMNLNPSEMATALGHAGSMSSGSRNVFATDTLIMHAGRAAQNGILAARLAREGFGSTTHALEKWVQLMTSDDNSDYHRILELKEGKWQLMENAFKPYPCGIVIHPGIDAGIEGHKFFKNLDDITKIEATVCPLTVRLCGVKHPKEYMQVLFSNHHGLAVGLVYGKGGIKEYSMEAANDPRVVSIRDRTTFVVDESFRVEETRVKYWYNENGQEKVKEVYIEWATGSYQNPMTDEQLNVKFEDQAIEGKLSSENIKKAISQSWELEKIDNIQSYMRLLIPKSK